MSEMLSAIDASIEEASKAIIMLGKKKTAQISTTEERAYLKAVCLSWLTTHRPHVSPCCNQPQLAPIDSAYQALLEAIEGRPSRKHIGKELKLARKELISLRSKLILVDPNEVDQSDKPPQFSKLSPDSEMQDILTRRWQETLLCMAGGANLAATVMMGGLLEALLLARLNIESDKKPVFTAKAAPKDRSTGSAVPLKEWGLRDYIDVAHELTWITKSAKDVGEVLRDYRNYIHPYKEHSHKVKLNKSDGLIFWGVTKSITNQLIASVP